MTKTNKKELIKLAFVSARRSGDPHLKVGAILIENFKNNTGKNYARICAEGYNHLPKNYKNLGYKDSNNKTRPEVIHAEAHALSYMFDADTEDNGKNYELFCTLSPCMECAKLIHLSGIKKIYFYNYYKDVYPLEFLKKCGVKSEQIL
jgi:deoxycytidylate deaminase